jgi:putative ABC transport system substrate-binding protein
MRFDQLNRRNLFSLLGGAAVGSPLTASAQPAMPVIGLIHLTSREQTHEYLAAFHGGLGETGYVEGRNVAIEYRWGPGQNVQLPTLVTELVHRKRY